MSAGTANLNWPITRLSSPCRTIRVLRKTLSGSRAGLASIGDGLESAEFALSHLGADDQTPDERLQNVVQVALAPAQTLRFGARSQIEITRRVDGQKLGRPRS